MNKRIFNIKDYKGKYVMYCGTIEKDKIFHTYLIKFEMIFRKGHNPGCFFRDSFRYGQERKSKTGHDFNSGMFANIDYWKKLGYTVLHFDDFDWSEVTDKDREKIEATRGWNIVGKRA